MKLLTEVDQPGSQIDVYVSQLSKVLSKKAAGLVNFQAQLARFQKVIEGARDCWPVHSSSASVNLELVWC